MSKFVQSVILIIPVRRSKLSAAVEQTNSSRNMAYRITSVIGLEMEISNLFYYSGGF